MKNIRHQQILEWLSSHGHAHLNDLTRLAGVRRLTIQRDLVELEQAGLLKRIRGGAMSLDSKWLSRPHEQRIQENRSEKDRIGQAAGARLVGMQCLGLDGSSTCTLLAPYLGVAQANGAATRTVLATSIDTFLALKNVPGVLPVLSGGVLHPVSGGTVGSLVGPQAIQGIKGFQYDAVCISALGFDPSQGVYDSNWDDVAVKQALMSVAQRIYLLVDHSKWITPRGMKVCDSEALTAVITDRHPGHEAAAMLPAQVELVVAPSQVAHQPLPNSAGRMNASTRGSASKRVRKPSAPNA